MSYHIEKVLRSLNSDYLTVSEIDVLLGDKSVDARYALIKRALSEGLLIHLKRGVYRRASYLEKDMPHSFEVAQYLRWPSYVSLESALSYHELIPEAVYTTTCATTLRPKIFKNDLGYFEYKKLPSNNFFIDVQRIQQKEAAFYVANPWKALCDYIFCYKKDWKNMSPAIQSLRLDIEDMPVLSKELGDALSRYYKSKRVSHFLNGVLDEH